MISNEPFPEHRCDENCQRYCEACDKAICTNEHPAPFVIDAGMIFCDLCYGIDKEAASTT